jgi:hypothetical protein
MKNINSVNVVHISHKVQDNTKYVQGDRYQNEGTFSFSASFNVKSLCGTASAYTYVYPIDYLDRVPLRPRLERLCKLCKKSKLYPLYLLSAMGE